MSAWAPRRFWTETTVAETGQSFTVLLDGRRVKTPHKADLAVPSRGFAERIAAEWKSQEEVVVPDTMPFTRAANTAIDKVSEQFDDVATMLIAYGETDLICYRAETPAALRERQAEAWDPLISWAEHAFEAKLQVTQGVLPVDQSAQSLARLGAEVRAMTPFQLVGFHDLVVLSGSLVLALAAANALKPASEIWKLSRLDEHWQIEQWGEDEEAKEAEERKRTDFLRALEVYKLANPR